MMQATSNEQPQYVNNERSHNQHTLQHEPELEGKNPACSTLHPPFFGTSL